MARRIRCLAKLLTLSEAIRWYTKGLEERSDLVVDLDIDEGFGRVPNQIELAVFRIVQECFTNIHRHSGSKTASLRLSRSAEANGLKRYLVKRLQQLGHKVTLEPMEAA